MKKIIAKIEEFFQKKKNLSLFWAIVSAFGIGNSTLNLILRIMEGKKGFAIAWAVLIPVWAIMLVLNVIAYIKAGNND